MTLVALSTFGAASAVQAAPAPAAYVISTENVNDRQANVLVFSPSMNKPVPIQIIHAADRSKARPTLYLLNGADGGEGSATWDKQSDAVAFFKDKNVNVVTPMGGRNSYYTDWERDDAVLGRNKWQTFLNQELPPVIEKVLGANGSRSIAAISMTGTSVLNLAIAKPGFWKSVASYSGCAGTSDPVGQEYVKLVVETWGGAQSVENMWGPLNGPGWRANDPVVNADKLRGTPIYISGGSGIPSAPNDTPANPRIADGRASLPAQIVLGSAIEAAVHNCNVNLVNRLNDLHIPNTFHDRPVGTHSWGYWQDDLHSSWPFLAQTLGV
jgi:S-formylglutathione hydrolase FrmB